MTPPVQLAFATDAGFFAPTILAMISALQHCPAGAKVYFLGTDLTTGHQTKLERAIALFDGAELHFHALSQSDFGDAVPPDPKITLTALARLFLPNVAQGRVLYIDGDTQIRGPLLPLFNVDMRGYPIAAVRDQYVLRQVYKGKPDAAYFREIMGDHPATDYFNSGVLLMELDAIQADAELTLEMQNFSKLDGYRYLDQDHLNHLFAGRTHFLPHRWNSVWGRGRYQSKLWRKLDLPEEERTTERPGIVHFTGPKKPWKKLRFSTITQSLPAVLAYRLFQRRWQGYL